VLPQETRLARGERILGDLDYPASPYPRLSGSAATIWFAQRSVWSISGLRKPRVASAADLAAGDGDFEGGADRTHPIIAEPAEAFDKRSERDALDRIEVDDRCPRNRILAWFEQHLAGDPADRGRTRSDQCAPQPRNRGISREHDDGPTSDLGKLAPPHLASGRDRGHDAPAAPRNEAKSPHSSVPQPRVARPHVWLY
jgi:hypothetical protein